MLTIMSHFLLSTQYHILFFPQMYILEQNKVYDTSELGVVCQKKFHLKG